MKLSNIFEAIMALPAIMLDIIVSGLHDFFRQEKELIKNGELDEEAIAEEQNEQVQNPR